MIRFHNTLGGRVEEFVPIEPGKVRLYTCGPTVYDYLHIGNLRAFVFEDLLKRFLRFAGFGVTHVMNITDVDDKTIRGANAAGLGLEDYTRPFIEAFRGDLGTLGIQPADHYPRAADPENIRGMAALIRTLLDKGFAYRKDGSIYFAIDRFPAYGRLSKVGLEDRRPGSRGDADEYEKESVHDFALWKAPKEGEPAWETEIGPGRPGWHIECSAMSSRYFGPSFDIHCGGVDNIFPHHENEIAQSEAASGVKFVNYWLHCHHLVVDGEKMAKSKGNFYRLADVLDRGFAPREVRFLLLSTHYRKMLNFTFEALKQARAGLRRIENFLTDLAGVKREGQAGDEARALVERTGREFREALGDDLNISAALAALFGLVKEANVLRERDALTRGDVALIEGFWRDVDEKVLAVGLSRPAERAPKVDDATHGRPASSPELRSADAAGDAEVDRLVEERQAARAAKDFARADALRRELLERGIVLEDTKDGVRKKKVEPPAKA